MDRTGPNSQLPAAPRTGTPARTAPGPTSQAGSPRDLHLRVNRLRLHLLDHGGPPRGVPLLLLHGLLEHAHAWDLVAPRLVAAGHRVLALDARGHGDSDRVGAGGYYHFPDYVADLAGVIDRLGPPVVLIGHSMGGNVTLLCAGSRPEHVKALITLEGLGPPAADAADAPARYASWIADMQRIPDPAPVARRSLTLADARRRLGERFPSFPPDALELMARHGTRPVDPALAAAADPEAGERTWKFDPLHQTGSPQPFSVVQAEAFWRRVTCPVLYVEGTRSYLTLPRDEVRRRTKLLGARVVTIDGASHHPHLERPAETANVLLEFLSDALSR